LNFSNEIEEDGKKITKTLLKATNSDQIVGIEAFMRTE
jgi:hypothetical protein